MFLVTLIKANWRIVLSFFAVLGAIWLELAVKIAKFCGVSLMFSSGAEGSKDFK